MIQPRRFAYLLFSLTLIASSYAVEYRGPDGISFDLPEGWTAFGEVKIESFSFTNLSRDAFLQVFRFGADESIPLVQIYDYVSESLGATGDRVPYLYSDRDAIFASIEFPAAGESVAGFAFCVRTELGDTVVIAYGPSSGIYQDELLSALDSIAVSDSDLNRPGPVSQFMMAKGDADATARITFAGFAASFAIDTGEFEVAQLVVDREARLLSRTDGSDEDTWKRFYRIIYRDSFSRLAKLGEEFARYAAGREKKKVAETLLDWVQEWEYSRTGTLADLLNPFEAALRESGDCDSRGLVYSTLLHYAGIESVLLVSAEYSHSVCAVDVDGEGARIDTEKGAQLIAEVTDDVSLGLIASDQANPDGWIVVDLDGKRGPR